MKPETLESPTSAEAGQDLLSSDCNQMVHMHMLAAWAKMASGWRNRTCAMQLTPDPAVTTNLKAVSNLATALRPALHCVQPLHTGGGHLSNSDVVMTTLISDNVCNSA